MFNVDSVFGNILHWNCNMFFGKQGEMYDVINFSVRNVWHFISLPTYVRVMICLYYNYRFIYEGIVRLILFSI